MGAPGNGHRTDWRYVRASPRSSVDALGSGCAAGQRVAHRCGFGHRRDRTARVASPRDLGRRRAQRGGVGRRERIPAQAGSGCVRHSDRAIRRLPHKHRVPRGARRRSTSTPDAPSGGGELSAPIPSRRNGALGPPNATKKVASRTGPTEPRGIGQRSAPHRRLSPLRSRQRAVGAANTRHRCRRGPANVGLRRGNPKKIWSWVSSGRGDVRSRGESRRGTGHRRKDHPDGCHSRFDRSDRPQRPCLDPRETSGAYWCCRRRRRFRS
jgi:hypothetical protein